MPPLLVVLLCCARLSASEPLNALHGKTSPADRTAARVRAGDMGTEDRLMGDHDCTTWLNAIPDRSHSFTRHIRAKFRGRSYQVCLNRPYSPANSRTLARTPVPTWISGDPAFATPYYYVFLFRFTPF